MLFLNNKPTELTAKMLKDFSKQLGYDDFDSIKWPLNIKLAETMMKEDGRGLKSAGNYHFVNLTASVPTVAGRDEWRFCSNVQYNANGQPIFLETDVKLRGVVLPNGKPGPCKTFNQKDTPLLYFLIMCSHQCKGGKNQSTNSADHVFEIDDKAKTNKARVDQELAVAEVTTILYKKLSEGEVLRLAKSYFISGAETIDSYTLRTMIRDMVLGKNHGGIKSFEKRIESKLQDVDLSVLVQNAKDFKVISYTPDNQTWHLNNDRHEPVQDLVVVAPTYTVPEEALVDYLETNSDMQSAIKLAIESIKKGGNKES